MKAYTLTIILYTVDVQVIKNTYQFALRYFPFDTYTNTIKKSFFFSQIYVKHCSELIKLFFSVSVL